MKATTYRMINTIGMLLLVTIAFQCNNPHQVDKKHLLPETDNHYKYTCGYIEDKPVDEYTWASDEAYEEFLDMKFGVRIHWGLYSILKQSHESWPLLKMPPHEKQKYFDQYKTWNPQGFDAEEWMDLFAECGMKMFAFTTKHHEGFSMFDTKTRVRKRVNWIAPDGSVLEECDLAFSIMETPFKRDVVKELCSAAHERGIKIDLYYSHPDWYDADFRPYVHHPVQVPSSGRLSATGRELKPENHSYRFGDQKAVMASDPTPEETERMIMRHRSQLKELLLNYGKIDMICFDMWLGPEVWPHLRETLMELRKIQPNVMFRARGIGNYGDYYTPEGFVPGDKENTDTPWFVIYPLGESFSYESDPDKHKGSKWVVDNIINCAAKGGNFMVGIGPNGNGKFHPTAVKQLKQVGEWLEKNGESIYATRAREGELWREGDNIRFTRSKNHKTIFAHCLEWPGDTLILKTIKAKKNAQVIFLGNETPLKWEHNAEGELMIHFSEDLKKESTKPNNLAYTFKISTDK